MRSFFTEAGFFFKGMGVFFTEHFFFVFLEESFFGEGVGMLRGKRRRGDLGFFS